MYNMTQSHYPEFTESRGDMEITLRSFRLILPSYNVISHSHVFSIL